MSKYDPALLEKAVRLVRQADSYSHGIEAVFDALERAPWWEEVGPEYRFRIGEPWRREVSIDSATEGTVRQDGQVGNGIARPDATWLRDIRWLPKPEADS